MGWHKQLELLRTNILALGARRVLALAVAGVVVLGVVATIALYSSRPETEPLYTGLSQSDVARIGASLNEAGIAYDVGADGTKIFVRRAHAPRARMHLAERGLPAGATSGYELFDKLGPLGLTSFMQDVTRVRALEGELARTIQTMKGVTSARVHIVMPVAGSFRKPQQPASASIVVRADMGARTQHTAQIIRHLVSAAVAGLASEHVNVMTTDGTVLAASGDASALGSAKMIELEQAVARHAQDNVRRTLAPYLGVENFEVSAAARINIDKRQLTEQAFDPESKAERSSRVIKETGSALNGGNKQAVTVEQNIPTEANGSTAPEVQSRKANEKRDELTNFELNSKSSSVMSEGHRVESLQVSLVVNRKRLPQSTSPADLERQLKEIETIAAASAGLDVKRGDKISVAAVDFIDASAEPGAKLSALERLSLHLDTVIISLTALAALLILLWLGLLPSVRAIIAPQRAALIDDTVSRTAPMLDTGSNAIAQVSAVTAVVGLSVKPPATSLAQTKLAELIERDERQVANVLKQWLVTA